MYNSLGARIQPTDILNKVHTFGTHSFLIPPIHHRDIFFWKIAAVILKTAHNDEPKTVPPLQKIDNSCYRVEPNTRFGIVQDTAAGKYVSQLLKASCASYAKGLAPPALCR